MPWRAPSDSTPANVGLGGRVVGICIESLLAWAFVAVGRGEEQDVMRPVGLGLNSSRFRGVEPG